MEHEIRQKVKEIIKQSNEALGIKNNKSLSEDDVLRRMMKINQANEKTFNELTKKYGKELVDKIYTEELDASKKNLTIRTFKRHGYDETLDRIEFAFEIGMLDEREYHNQLDVLEELKAKQQS